MSGVAGEVYPRFCFVTKWPLHCCQDSLCASVGPRNEYTTRSLEVVDYDCLRVLYGTKEGCQTLRLQLWEQLAESKTSVINHGIAHSLVT